MTTPRDGLPVLPDPREVAEDLIREHFRQAALTAARPAVVARLPLNALRGEVEKAVETFAAKVAEEIRAAEIAVSWPAEGKRSSAAYVEAERSGGVIVLERPTIREIPVSGGSLKVLIGADVELELTDSDGFEHGMYLTRGHARVLAAHLALAADELERELTQELAP